MSRPAPVAATAVAPVAAASGALLARRALGVCAVAAAIASPWSITATEIAVGAGIVCALPALLSRRVTCPGGPVGRALLLFAAVWLVAALAADRSVSAVSHAAHMWPLAAAPFAAIALSDSLWRRRTIIAFLASEALLGVFCTWQHLTRIYLFGAVPRSAEPGAALGAFSVHLTLAGHAMLGTAIAWAAVTQAATRRERALAVSAAALIGLALVWSFGRSAWIGLAFSTACSLLVVSGRRRAALASALAALVVAVLLVPVLRDRFTGLVSADVIGPRLILWKTSVRIIAAHPLLGAGPGHWRDAFETFRLNGAYPSTAHPHSDPLGIAVNAGGLGLLAFLLLWGVVLRQAARSARRPLSPVRGAALATLLGGGALLVAGLFQCYQTDAEVAFLAWGLVGAAWSTGTGDRRRAALRLARPNEAGAARAPDAAPMPISVAVVARDAERTLGRCLASVEWADDVLVVLDPRSADASGDIARAHGARVVENVWTGYAAQKARALALAHHDWVLLLDADEEVSPALREAIEARKRRGPEDGVCGYAFPRRSHYLGRWIRRAWGPDVNLRLVDRRCARVSDRPLHERLVAEGRTIRLAAPLLHYPYANVADHLARADRYSSLAALALEAEGRRARWTDIVVRPPAHFLRSYVLRGGMCDGYAGLVIASIGASGVLAKYLKLRERQRARGATTAS